MAAALNLSHSNPLPPPPVALVWPVDVWPIRTITQFVFAAFVITSAGDQFKLPPASILLVRLRML